MKNSCLFLIDKTLHSHGFLPATRVKGAGLSMCEASSSWWRQGGCSWCCGVLCSLWLQKLLRGFLMLLQLRAVGLQQGGAVQEGIRSCHPLLHPRPHPSVSWGNPRHLAQPQASEPEELPCKSHPFC